MLWWICVLRDFSISEGRILREKEEIMLLAVRKEEIFIFFYEKLAK